jgi:hypothetical protein
VHFRAMPTQILVHFGPMPTQIFGEAIKFMTFIDECCGKIWIYF